MCMHCKRVSIEWQCIVAFFALYALPAAFKLCASSGITFVKQQTPCAVHNFIMHACKSQLQLHLEL